MKKRIYTDASIIGGCLDIEFESGSISLFKGFSTGKNIIVVSSPTLVELEKAPKPVQDIL